MPFYVYLFIYLSIKTTTTWSWIFWCLRLTWLQALWKKGPYVIISSTIHVTRSVLNDCCFELNVIRIESMWVPFSSQSSALFPYYAVSSLLESFCTGYYCECFNLLMLPICIDYSVCCGSSFECMDSDQDGLSYCLWHRFSLNQRICISHELDPDGRGHLPPWISYKFIMVWLPRILSKF